MKFANIIMDRVGRVTVGDDIQVLAIENLYRHMGVPDKEVVRIPYSELTTYYGNGEYLVLPISFPFHGFCGYREGGPCITQFSDRIIPVFLGMSTLTNSYSADEVEYLRRFQPIGCRDQWTMNAMRSHGLSAYLGGCMTATFPRIRYGADGREKVFFVDVPESFLKYVPMDVLENGEFVSHVFMTGEFEGSTEELARKVYKRYADEARMVVTTRMHGALPCLAAGIPVIMAKDTFSVRFTMLERLLHIYQPNEFDSIDWNPSSVDFSNLKQAMLDNAAKRVMEAYSENVAMCEISEAFESKSYLNTSQSLDIDGVTNAIRHLKTNCDSDSFPYAVWGISQTAMMLVGEISRCFPNARLEAIIDRRTGLDFLGLKSVSKEWLSNHPDVLCIVCAGAPMPEAQDYCSAIGHERLYCAWHDGLSR